MILTYSTEVKNYRVYVVVQYISPVFCCCLYLHGCVNSELVCDCERIGVGGRRNPQVLLWPYVFQLSIIHQFEKAVVFGDVYFAK